MKERLKSQIDKIKTYAEQVGALRAAVEHPKRGEDIEALNIQLQRTASGLERSYNRALSIIEQIPAE
jgi:hypothetical protein